MTRFFGFHTIKALTALIGADWGCQTLPQAIHKNHCWRHRTRHVAIVAGIQGLSAVTANTTWPRWLLFVTINAATHYIIDSHPLPKWLDQALHATIAILTAPLLATIRYNKTQQNGGNR